MTARLADCEISRLKGWQWTLLFLITPVLLWPAIVNGGPFFFPDTAAYVRSVDAAAVRVAGRTSEWTSSRTLHIARKPAPAAASPAPVPPAAAADGNAPFAHDLQPVLSGRSPYYGAFLYLGVLLGSLWLPIVMQALIAAAMVLGLLRHAVDPAHRRTYALSAVGTAGLLALTPLPYFASILMPDVFSGFAIVAAAVLMTRWHHETRVARIAWAGLATYGALCHASVTLILLGLAGLGALWWILRVRSRRGLGGLLVVTLAAVTGLAGDAAFSSAVTRLTGQPPIRPPFITARLTADGAGTAFLARDCATTGWALCRYRHRLPLHSDSFLWSPDPRSGVFMTIAPAEQRALSDEQMRFALAVARTMPMQVLRSSLGAFGEQIGSTRLIEFIYPRADRRDFEAKLPPPVVTDIRTTAAYRGTMPIDLVAKLVWPLTLAALAIVATALRRHERRDLAALGIVAAAGWIVNDMVCAALSTPHDRYQMRVIWIVPLVAAAIAAAWHDLRRRRADLPSHADRATSP